MGCKNLTVPILYVSIGINHPKTRHLPQISPGFIALCSDVTKPGENHLTATSMHIGYPFFFK